MDSVVGGRAAHSTVPTTTLPVHPLTRYLKVKLGVANGVVQWTVPQALAGVLPIGRTTVEIPLADVDSVAVKLRLRPFDLMLGSAAVAAPLILGWGWLGAPVVVIGAWITLASFNQYVVADVAGGSAHRAPVCFGHRFDAELYRDAVNDLLD